MMVVGRNVCVKPVLFRLSAEKSCFVDAQFRRAFFFFSAPGLCVSVAWIALRYMLWVAMISDSCPAGILFLTIATVCSLLGDIEH